MLHLPRLLRRPTEKENTTGQSVQPVDRPEVLQIVLLRQDEDDGVVPVSSTRVHLESQDLISFIHRENQKRKFEGGDCDELERIAISMLPYTEWKHFKRKAE